MTSFCVPWVQVLVGMSLAVASSPVFAQGPLAPPGPPAPVMKTLDQVEPRTPITNLPYEILSPGSYYLTGNLTSTGHGIVVRADGASVDLMGFTLTGSGASSFRGVLVEKTGLDPIRDVSVRNGSLERFGTGLYASRSWGGRYESLNLRSNVNDGVLVQYGEGNTIEGVSSHGNGQHGVYVYGLGASCNGHLLRDAVVIGNVADGIRLFGDFGEASANRILGAFVSGNGGSGIAVVGGSGAADDNVIEDAMIVSNMVNGITVSVGSGSADGNEIRRGAVSGQGGYGIAFQVAEGRADGNVVEACNLRSNGDSAMEVAVDGGRASGNRFTDNRITGNNGHGIRFNADNGGETGGNRIENCTVVGQAADGIVIRAAHTAAANGNVIARNNIGDNQDGIVLEVFTGGLVRGSEIRGNTIYDCTDGIRCGELDAVGGIVNNRIEDNLSTGNVRDLNMSDPSQGNLIVRNMFSAGALWFPSIANPFGPMVDTAYSELPGTGDPVHPWANFRPPVE